MNKWILSNLEVLYKLIIAFQSTLLKNAGPPIFYKKDLWGLSLAAERFAYAEAETIELCLGNGKSGSYFSTLSSLRQLGQTVDFSSHGEMHF